MTNCLSKWLYNSVFPSAVSESCYCSTSLPVWCLLVFWILDFLIGMSWYHAVVLICNFLIRKFDVEHPFICLLAICISSLVRYLFRFLIFFFKQVVYFFIVEHRVLCIFWITVLYQVCLLQTFSMAWLFVLLTFSFTE